MQRETCSARTVAVTGKVRPVIAVGTPDQALIAVQAGTLVQVLIQDLALVGLVGTSYQLGYLKADSEACNAKVTITQLSGAVIELILLTGSSNDEEK